MTISEYLRENPIKFPVEVTLVRKGAEAALGASMPRSTLVAALGAAGYVVAKPRDQYVVFPTGWPGKGGA